MYRPKPQVAAIIDTSGSMSDLQTGVAVAELSSLIQRLGIPVHVLSVDAAIHHAVQAFGRVDKKLYGGGGTDMALGIREAVKMRPRPNLIVVFTDGLTGWPAENPGVPVVVVLITDDVISTPEWVRTIRVHPSEFVAKETVRFRREGER
jgi:predicted metal-dependent peptidase